MTQIRRPSSQADVVRPRAGDHQSQSEEGEGMSPVPADPTEDQEKKERQIALLRDHVSALRRERDWVEATLLNQHIYRASAEHMREDALEDLRDATQEEYAQLLERELQPTLDYFEMIDEELIKAIPLEEEEDPNFDYPGDYDWKEGDYMWLLFKIQQHFAHREIWNGVYGFIGHTQPQRKARSRQAMIELTETWQDLFDKTVHVKRRAHRYLDEKKKGGRRDYEGIQPPPDTLVPPNVPTIDESRGPLDAESRREQEDCQKEGVRGPPSKEQTKEDSKEAAVEAVRKMTASNSSLESSAKSGRWERSGRDWDPTYNGFVARDREVKPAVTPPRGRGGTRPRGTQIGKTLADTPKARPLPTLREIHQINLRRALEEERADLPCDICGKPDHDYRRCQAGSKAESQGFKPGIPPEEQDCRNCDKAHKGQCPCGWCGEYGHISAECPAKFYSQSMKDRFPKRKKAKRKRILEYTCRRCEEKHPFNRYCPYAVEPPIIPGECRSCATLTNVHDDECEMVAIKDRIGLCAFCGDISHPYAECPERYPNKGPKKVMGRATTVWESTHVTDWDDNVPRPLVYYGVCSFCGSVGHGHEECPGLKEAVQEQAAQLAQLQIARYEATRMAPLKEEDEQAPRAEGHQQGPQRTGMSTGGGGPGPGDGG